MALSPENVVDRFREAGGLFNVGAAELIAKAHRLQALVFDWDGVFNDGTKDSDAGSPFAEADSMGLNLLRFGLHQSIGRLPSVCVITGEHNSTALHFARRERLHCVYRGIPHKVQALADFCDRFGLASQEVAVLFDDVNDLSLLPEAGLRVLVRRPAGILFTDYVFRHGLCDYATFSEGGANAVREVCELLLGVLGRFDAVLHERTQQSPAYRSYWEERQQVETLLRSERDGRIVTLGEAPS